MKRFFEALKKMFRTLFGGGNGKDSVPEEEPQIPEREPQDGGDLNDPSHPAKDPEAPTPQPEFSSRYAWIIDCGHTQFTPGKRSPKLSDGRQLLEYEINHWIGDRLIQRLKDRKIEVFKTCRPDEFPETELGDDLAKRCQRANNYASSRPKLFVSIHHNAAGDGWSPAMGTETFIFTFPSNEEASETMGNIFQRRLIDKLKTRNRGLKRAGLYVLRHTSMPACLLEVEFFTHQDQVIHLLGEAFRNKTIDAVEAAILEIEEEGLPNYPFVI